MEIISLRSWGQETNCCQRSHEWPVRKGTGNVNGSSGSSVAKVKRHPTVARQRYGVRGFVFLKNMCVFEGSAQNA